jgi:Mn2+/Fe2+ NRAMP family transporter
LELVHAGLGPVVGGAAAIAFAVALLASGLATATVEATSYWLTHLGNLAQLVGTTPQSRISTL